MEKRLEKQPENTKLRELLADGYLKMKDYKKVINTLNPYTNTISVSALLELAGAYHQTSAFKDEIRIIQLLLVKNDVNPQAHFILGHAHFAYSKTLLPTEKPKEESLAIEAFRKSIQQNPKYKPAYDGLLEIFIANDNRYEARGVLNDIISKFGKRPEAYNELCRLLALDGFLEQGIETCDQAIKLSPQHANSYVYLARAYSDKDDTKKTGAILTQAVKKFPKSEFVATAAGDFYLTQKNFPVAIRYFKQSTLINPKSSQAHLLLGKSYVSNSQFKEGLPHFIQACEIDVHTKDSFQEVLGKVRQLAPDEIENQYSQAFHSCNARALKK